jgi:hypothetical protein
MKGEKYYMRKAEINGHFDELERRLNGMENHIQQMEWGGFDEVEMFQFRNEIGVMRDLCRIKRKYFQFRNENELE